MTSKQRAALRAMANNIDTIFQVGKDGLGDAFYKQVDEALEARELIKLRVLEASGLTARAAADEIAARCNAQPVQVIGSRFVLYRPAKKPVIKL
ncbi:RNA-binding protein YhbY [bioreactor metagenome]|uniref:RNA-binding protein YhbY n=1 Tax=bioreactor metagenome TaxID=1076179 RepID=A0A644WZH1_9ZZZZ